MISRNFNASIGYSIVFPEEIRSSFFIRLINDLFALLFKNINFLLSVDKLMCLSKNNLFFLYICLTGKASKNSLAIKIIGPEFI